MGTCHPRLLPHRLQIYKDGSRVVHRQPVQTLWETRSRGQVRLFNLKVQDSTAELIPQVIRLSTHRTAVRRLHGHTSPNPRSGKNTVHPKHTLSL